MSCTRSPRFSSVTLLGLVMALWPRLCTAQSSSSDSSATAKIAIAPLPVIFYTPETRTAVGAALNIFHRPAGSTNETRPSTVAPIFIYTFENQVIAAVEARHYWNAERNVSSSSLSYINFPSSFYAIGNENDADESEDYATETYGFSLDYLRELWPNVRVGAGVVLGRSTLSEKEAGGRLDRGDIPGSNGGGIVGFGLLASRDNRDNITFPAAGGLYQLSAYAFDGALGSDFDYRTLSLETRTYRGLGGGRILALRTLAMYTDGRVPFQVLPSLGGDSLLRGYFGGRFRDRQLAAVEAELRWQVWRRLGLVTFGGLGQVAHRLDEFSFEGFHRAAGLGLRFLVIPDEGLNIRFDAGWGEDDSGTYISLGEAF